MNAAYLMKITQSIFLEKYDGQKGLHLNKNIQKINAIFKL